ncbi:MAG: NADH-quinone oxidoreductase subunit N, partial [Myxococcota bacterium]
NDAAAADSGVLILVGMLLILSGFAFKVAAVPFHVWTPDVYTGSPTPGVGYMSTAVKAGAFAALVRVCVLCFEDPALRGGFFGIGWVDVLFFLAAGSMVLGNAVAIMQDNVKRMLAYSSIAHAGYILTGFVSAGARPEFFLYNDSVLFYLLTYTFGTLGAFGVLSYLGKSGSTVETYDDLAGLGLKYPFAGLMMGIFMFSSAGVPPTAGFVGKFYVFRSAVEVGAATDERAFIALAVLGVVTSAAGAYYYLRVLVNMYMRPVSPNNAFEAADQDRGARFSLIVCALCTLGLGVFPAPGLELSRYSIVDFQGAPEDVQEVLKEGRRQLDQLEQGRRDRQAGARVKEQPASEAEGEPN